MKIFDDFCKSVKAMKIHKEKNPGSEINSDGKTYMRQVCSITGKSWLIDIDACSISRKRDLRPLEAFFSDWETWSFDPDHGSYTSIDGQKTISPEDLQRMQKLESFK